MERRQSQVEGINEKILVVGGGFIGGSFAKYAVDKGHEVSVISLTHKEPVHPEVTSIQCDITDPVSVKSILQNNNYSYVVNCAGYINHSDIHQGGIDVIAQHYTGVLNLVANLSTGGLKKFLQLGSSDEYGYAPAPQSEDMRESPLSPYSFGKVATTQFLQMMHKTKNFPAVIIRPFLVYGPRQNADRLLPYVIQKCIDNKEFKASEGKQIRDYCFIDDFIKGVYQSLISEQTTGYVMNLASGIPISISDVINKVTDAVGGGKPEFGALAYRKNENMELYASIEKARTLIGWEPKTDIDSGLEKTIEYYKNYHA